MKRTRTAPAFDKLANGEDYVVYRFMVYADGFHVYASQVGSAEGIYLQPLGIPPSLRNDESSILNIAIVPPGASTAPVLLCLKIISSACSTRRPYLARARYTLTKTISAHLCTLCDTFVVVDNSTRLKLTRSDHILAKAD